MAAASFFSAPGGRTKKDSSVTEKNIKSVYVPQKTYQMYKIFICIPSVRDV
ncbi:hypothetical protein BRYFOR_05726 [Marvinbryantia formatexigens DSM 14469]|uniref:Uncharacterized protein n=1 Tax=Marvinbryantia formatexigens DSM 14469 TaxID=478749 RepID=C6LAT2_9FIRM|nr:hypothetical protein BRYFOR_05726 [Marvinbryantia formatexigens DSM 14469]